jgi:hypothetical protein
VTRVLEEAITDIVTGNAKPFINGGKISSFLFRNDQPSSQHDITIAE